MQRSHTLPFVLTLGAACGSGPKAAPTELGEQPSIVTMPSAPTAPAADAGVPTVSPIVLPPAHAPPQLACADETSARPAPHPELAWFCVRDTGERHGPYVTLFPDRTIATTGSYKDGKLDGAWTRYYLGGAIAEEGAYALGLPDGTWRQYTRDGAKLGEYTLAAGTGTQQRWFDDGGLYRQVALEKGVPHGWLTVRERDGKVVIRAKYRGGKLHGDHVAGTKNMLRIEETFRNGVRVGPRKIWQFWALLVDETYDARGRLDGPFAIWRDKKVPRVRGTYAHGKRIGSWRWTDRQNRTEQEGTYADGKKSGTWAEYSNGKLLFRGPFTDGKPDGELVYYGKTGAELGRFTIRGGTGTMVTFHPNKKPSSKARMRKGLLDGTYEELTPRGKVIVEGHYASDKKHGWWREWTETGALVSEIHYQRGKLDGSFKKYVAGKLAVAATYKDGKADGDYIEYRDEKPALTGQFTADLRSGTWTRYDSRGMATLTATYSAGVLDGPWREVTQGHTVEGQLVAGRPSGTWIQTDRAGATRQIAIPTP